MDYQGNLTDSLRADESKLTVMDLLTGEAAVKEVIQHGERWDMIASSPALAGTDMDLSGKGKEHLLRRALEHVRKSYDYILIDTPPALGILLTNALTASTKVIIPAQADRYSLKSIAQLNITIGAVKKYANENLSVQGILLTRYNGRSILNRDFANMIEQAAQKIGTKVFKARIREAIAIKEAQAMQQDIFTYAPKSNAARDYEAFTNEIIGELKKNG